AALKEPPTPSMASLSERVEGYAAVPLNVRCSRKWATPTWPGASRRDPARTYAATDADRAPARRALMTRGPSGSVVRSNIGSMVQAGVGRPLPGGRTAGRAGARIDRPAPDGRRPTRVAGLAQDPTWAGGSGSSSGRRRRGTRAKRST